MGRGWVLVSGRGREAQRELATKVLRTAKGAFASASVPSAADRAVRISVSSQQPGPWPSAALSAPSPWSLPSVAVGTGGGKRTMGLRAPRFKGRRERVVAGAFCHCQVTGCPRVHTRTAVAVLAGPRALVARWQAAACARACLGRGRRTTFAGGGRGSAPPLQRARRPRIASARRGPLDLRVRTLEAGGGRWATIDPGRAVRRARHGTAGFDGARPQQEARLHARWGARELEPGSPQGPGQRWLGLGGRLGPRRLAHPRCCTRTSLAVCAASCRRTELKIACTRPLGWGASFDGLP